MTKQEVLDQCIIKGNSVFLPYVQLDRKLYMEVDKALKGIGGKWNRKEKAHVFQEDPSVLLGRVKEGESINLKNEFQFFATPSSLAERLVDYANLKNHDTILEPSAGQGAIIEHINKQCSVTPECFELMETNKLMLNKTGLNFNLIGDDFLKSDNKEYSKIIANPPFSKNQDIMHVYKMYQKLSEGGRLVSIMSKHWQNSTNKRETEFRTFIEGINAEVIEIDSGEFKESGTSVATVIIIIDK